MNYSDIQLQNNRFYPDSGGVVTHFGNLAEQFVSMGCAVEVLCETSNGLAEAEDISGVQVKRHAGIDLSGRKWLFEPFVRTKALEGYIKSSLVGNPGKVIAGNPLYAYASKKAHPNDFLLYIMPAIAETEHYLNFPVTDIKSRIYRGIISCQYRMIEKEVVRKADRIVVISKMRQKEFSLYYKISEDRFKVIYPGVDVDEYKPSPKDEELLEKLDIPKDAKVILCVCRLIPHKNIPFLIKALKKVEMDDVYVVVVGGGPEEKNINDFAVSEGVDDRVRIMGFQEDTKKFFSIADLFALPSLHEGFGLVLLEAMACGLPCVAIRPDYPEVILASDEIIEEGLSGYMVDHSDVDDMAAKIGFIISNDSLARSMGARSREICLEKFSWEVHAKRVLELLR